MAETKFFPLGDVNGRSCEGEQTKEDIFIVFDGKRIAKRGRPGTPEAGKWVSLQPGYLVYEDDTGEVVVEERKVVQG